MNEYTKNLNRIEFVMTLACTGKCRHCSQGEHRNCPQHIDGDLAAGAVRDLAGVRKIESVMTFGGEPLLYPDDVCKIHNAAKEMHIPKREIITNGYFSKNNDRIKAVAEKLCESGVNSIMLSVDAFHQETIPIEYVKLFAECIKTNGVKIEVHPAWLVSEKDDNPYNAETVKLLESFYKLGIGASSGNVIFPSGNALKYFGEYFDGDDKYESPYEQNPDDIRAVTVSPNGDVLCGNINDSSIVEIIETYRL